jgi:hypothetical protein
MEQVRTELGLPYTALCMGSDLPYSTLMRWKRRKKQRKPLWNPPGPKKTEPVDWNRLELDIRNLAHRYKRTHGTGELYQRYRYAMSRREFQEHVRRAREEAWDLRLATTTRITWNTPGLVWAMDDTGTFTDSNGIELRVQNIRDMASRYELTPLAGDMPHGEEIAGHLEALFRLHGAPLFLKRDNGGNQNHLAVNDVLARYWVIPLNSPTYYPEYNGSVERAQQELQTACEILLADKPPCPPVHAEAYVRLAAHDLNHNPRRSFKGRTPCRIFNQTGRNAMIDIRERKEVTDHLIETTAAVIAKIDEPTQRTVNRAWRLNSEQWLQDQGHITVSVKSPVLPSFLT